MRHVAVNLFVSLLNKFARSVNLPVLRLNSHKDQSSTLR